MKKVKVAQSCPTLCDPMDYTIHGILQARILEWVALPFSRGSSQPRDRIQVSRIAGEPQGKPLWLWRASLKKGQSLRPVTGTQMLIMTLQLLSRSVVSDSLWPHGLQPTRLLCPWGFSRQEYWSGLPCPPPGDLPNPGIEPRFSALQVDSLPSEPQGKSNNDSELPKFLRLENGDNSSSSYPRGIWKITLYKKNILWLKGRALSVITLQC